MISIFEQNYSNSEKPDVAQKIYHDQYNKILETMNGKAMPFNSFQSDVYSLGRILLDLMGYTSWHYFPQNYIKPL